jgi:predicted ArsR family transcriptional regulator
MLYHYTEAEYADWNARYREASCALTDREEKLAEVAELIEQDCYVTGATAVEDKLQVGLYKFSRFCYFFTRRLGFSVKPILNLGFNVLASVVP